MSSSDQSRCWTLTSSWKFKDLALCFIANICFLLILIWRCDWFWPRWDHLNVNFVSCWWSEEIHMFCSSWSGSESHLKTFDSDFSAHWSEIIKTVLIWVNRSTDGADGPGTRFSPVWIELCGSRRNRMLHEVGHSTLTDLFFCRLPPSAPTPDNKQSPQPTTTGTSVYHSTHWAFWALATSAVTFVSVSHHFNISSAFVSCASHQTLWNLERVRVSQSDKHFCPQTSSSAEWQQQNPAEPSRTQNQTKETNVFHPSCYQKLHIIFP